MAATQVAQQGLEQDQQGLEQDQVQQERSYKNYTAKWKFSKSNLDDSDEDESDPVLLVDFYKDGNLLYTLKRNDYRTAHHKFLLLEYFEIDGQVVHLFNLEHSVISIINADTGEEIHHDDLFDTFIEDYKMFDDREYMYISGWIWTPIPVRAIYHIPTFLKTPNYEPIFIGCSDNDSSINLYGCATVKEFLEKRDGIVNKYYLNKSTTEFNQNRTKEILLRVLLNPDERVQFKDESAKEKLQQLLDTEQSDFTVKTVGMLSGDHLSQYDSALYKVIEYDDSSSNSNKPSRLDTLTFLCPKMLFYGFTKNLPIERVYLRFEVSGSVQLTIHYEQELTWDGKEANSYEPGVKRCMVDETKPCRILIE